jgi:uncharacterized integral membrane protein
MRSTLSPSASVKARSAANSEPMRALARAGLAARGVIYVLIGLVAFLVAFGLSSRQANQEGALQLLAAKPYGLIALWLLAIGFACYALWRLSEAAFGVTGEGNGAGPRLRSLGSAIVYAFLAYLTFTVISGAHHNQTRKQQDITASAMHHTGGRWAVGIAGLIIVIIGLVLIVQGVRRTFMKYMQTARMSPRVRQTVEALGVIGTVARGVVFGLVGILVMDAAITHKASESGGLDKALLTLRHQPYGQLLLVAAALGLIAFGVYGLCEARWRQV